MAIENVLIFTALRFEADGMARGLNLRFSSPIAASGGRGVLLRVIGPRAGRLPVEPPAGCRGVILAGLGGGIVPGLKRGEVVWDEQSTLDLPSHLRRMKFVTADRVIATPRDKQELHKATGGAVVDMETDAVRAWAERYKLPYAGIRAISDAADECLDPAVLRFVDASGFTRASSVMREVIHRPSLIRTLWRLRHSRAAVRNLADALRSLIA